MKRKTKKTEAKLLPGTYTNDFGVVAVVVLSADAVVSTEGETS